MKKKLLALAVAGAFVAPVAMADTANVNIYGHANVSVDSFSNGTTLAASTRSTQVSDNVSYIGLKGSEDLGGGTSAIWQLESAVSLDGAAGSTLGTRNSFAGLSGESWGTVLLGRHDSPYKLATRGLDLFADTIADNRSLMGQTGGGAAFGGTSHDVRATDVVAYISPAFSGVTVAVAYVAGAEQAVAATPTKGSAWSLAGMYGAGPINASLAYQVVDGGDAPTNPAQPIPFGIGPNNKATAWKLGGGYTMDAFAVNAAYEHTTSTLAGLDKLAQNNWYVAGKFNVSASDAVKLAYTHAGTNPQVGTSIAVVASDAKQWSLGYDHNLSKRTTVYALYTKLSNNTNAAYVLGGGVTTGGTIIATPDADPSAISLGLKHTF